MRYANHRDHGIMMALQGSFLTFTVILNVDKFLQLKLTFFFHQRRAHIFPFAIAVYHHALLHAEPIHDSGVSHCLLSF
jgi:hypothetical protein